MSRFGKRNWNCCLRVRDTTESDSRSSCRLTLRRSVGPAAAGPGMTSSPRSPTKTSGTFRRHPTGCSTGCAPTSFSCITSFTKTVMKADIVPSGKRRASSFATTRGRPSPLGNASTGDFGQGHRQQPRRFARLPSDWGCGRVFDFGSVPADPSPLPVSTTASRDQREMSRDNSTRGPGPRDRRSPE